MYRRGQHIIYHFIVILILTIQKVWAQDIHFTQFSMSPLNLNPAFAGYFDGDYRAGAIYRSQWSAVPVPYATASLMGDMRFEPLGHQLGGGFVFNHDVSGDSHYGTNQFYLPLAYHRRISSDSSLFVSLGLQPGISNIGFRINNLSFDSQFDGDNYNPALSPDENFPAFSRTYFDLNSGLAIHYYVNQQTWFVGSFAVSHINRPGVSFFKNQGIQLDVKTQTYLALNLRKGLRSNFMPEILFEKQGKFQELLAGAKVSCLINENEAQSINFGAYMRARDAVLLRAGYNYKQWQFGMSYDINTSAFRAATNRRGAIEFALIYIFKKEVPFIPKKRVCPVYM